MYKKNRSKIFNYKKSILILFLIIFFIYTFKFDKDNITKICNSPDQALYEIRSALINLLVSILGKIVIFLVLLCLYYNFYHLVEIKRLKNRLNLWANLSYYINQVGEEVFNELPIGIVLVDNVFHKIQWINNYANNILKKPDLDAYLKDVNSSMFELLESSNNKVVLHIGEEVFDCLYKKEFNVFYLFNVTEREQIKEIYNQKTPTLIFVSFDNLDNSFKKLDLSEQSQIKVEYLSALSDFFEIYESYLKQLSDDKFLVLLNYYQLENIIKDKFSILKTVRDISNKYKLKITLSIGVACYNLPYNKISNYAQNALELAQKRGGDQAVVNVENKKILYFGATTTSLGTDSKISARINSEIIEDLILKHQNCFIMGHIHPDLDSLGSMILFYKIASSINTNYKHYLIIDEDKTDANFKFIYQDLFQEEKHLAKQIIKTSQAIKMINENSLLVIVDTQSLDIVNSPELLKLTSNVIILDHHRATENTINNIFSYVNSMASSTVEILTEFISFFKYSIEITPLEASLIYGGMVIDTNYFTARTSSRTLEAAAKLLSLGADVAKVKFWLREELNKILEMNELIAKMELYMGKFAIIRNNKICNDRSFLAKISEYVLNIQSVDAAFTVSKLQDNKIGISARSYSEINVQIIMEQMGGGGHINSAATQIESDSLDDIISQLKNILSLEYKESLKNMKIILLEDVKNRGKKNDIIEIKYGYGNFLIKEKKALLATEQNIKQIKKEQILQEEAHKKHNLLMQQVKKDIDDKQIDIIVNIGPQGKMYGKITLQQIVDEFHNKYNILINKKKLVLESEINSLGKYKANVFLTKDIIASFIINIKDLDKK
ncbi:50S ribosomal protein L9 [Columbia Basin potato purple top phytoplasma]|uniref:Large ribosomal subunit protein bL9 n=1 Tax=Columbia Basin potato purple top phytoplasma TaxID=307134 RepID=A0ABT5L952_9MOLU|nr:50S ribosomal protein L9 [Columbia Basin potato purple top phytoplasma]MDC9031789.1 50S ribosomal protein L9 [Columbia Basin potato purple top phytoplasma]